MEFSPNFITWYYLSNFGKILENVFQLFKFDIAV